MRVALQPSKSAIFIDEPGKTKAYISIHYMRCVSVATRVRCQDLASDWHILGKMGSGVSRYDYSLEHVNKLLDIMRATSTGADVHLDDLACFMCLSS